MHAVSGLFHSHRWVLFAFPSRYYTLSVIGSYLALEGGPPVFAPGSSCPALLLNRPPAHPSYKGLSPAKAPLSSGLLGLTHRIMPAYPALLRFGLLPLRSPLLRESRLISSPPGNWMFRFPGFAPASLRVSSPKLEGLPHSEAQGSLDGAPRPGVSPLPASFIADRCLGIPRVHILFITLFSTHFYFLCFLFLLL